MGIEAFVPVWSLSMFCCWLRCKNETNVCKENGIVRPFIWFPLQCPFVHRFDCQAARSGTTRCFWKVGSRFKASQIHENLHSTDCSYTWGSSQLPACGEYWRILDSQLSELTREHYSVCSSISGLKKRKQEVKNKKNNLFIKNASCSTSFPLISPPRGFMAGI